MQPGVSRRCGSSQNKGGPCRQRPDTTPGLPLPGDAVRAIYRLLAMLFLGLGILAIVTYLPLYDGYLPPFLRVVDQFVPAVFFLFLMALAFFGLAARCHWLSQRHRQRR